MSEAGEETGRSDDAADLDVVAARWFHRLAAAHGDQVVETRRAFQQWLEAGADHAEAFARTTATWSDVEAHGAAPEMMALREAAIADSRSAGLARWRPTPRMSPNRWRVPLAACLVLAAGAAADLLFRPAPTQVYATEIGERHAITLADNSRVDIDADSQVSVDYTPERRLIRIVRGQAYFQVEKNPARPFIVEANGRDVVATGTAFDVENLVGGVRVTLVEGHVVVQPATPGSVVSGVDLSPNDQLIEQSGEPSRVTHLSSTLPATAWRQGKLLFDNEPLALAVARMNRYSHLQVVVDTSVSDIRIGGAFDAGDVTDFLGALKAYYLVDTISDRPGELRLVRRRS